MNSHLRILIAKKEVAEGRRIGIRTITKESGASRSTVQAMLNNTWKHAPRDDMKYLCEYLDCTPNDLFKIEEVPDENPADTATPPAE